MESESIQAGLQGTILGIMGNVVCVWWPKSFLKSIIKTLSVVKLCDCSRSTFTEQNWSGVSVSLLQSEKWYNAGVARRKKLSFIFLLNEIIAVSYRCYSTFCVFCALGWVGFACSFCPFFLSLSFFSPLLYPLLMLDAVKGPRSPWQPQALSGSWKLSQLVFSLFRSLFL